MAVIEVNSNNFQEEVLNSSQPVLVDFWAPWCGPCRMVGPVVEQISDELDGVVKVAKVNVDEEQELASAFKIMSIPTLIVMKDGKIVNKAVGYRPKEEIKSMLNE